jgi:transposase-like protein
MDCVGSRSGAVTERSDLTEQGYRRFRCRDCDKQFNERSDGVLNRASLPSDIIAFVVLCRLRYRLTLQDLSEIMLFLRGFTVGHETIRRWESKLLPVMGEALRKRRYGIGRISGQSWYADETYLKVHGRWCYLYRAIDSIRSTLGRSVRHRTSVYLNNRLEQDHREIKGRIRCMRGFKEHEAADRFCREYDELRNFLRSRSRHNQYVPASRRRRHFLQRARIAMGHHSDRIIRRFRPRNALQMAPDVTEPRRRQSVSPGFCVARDRRRAGRQQIIRRAER